MAYEIALATDYNRSDNDKLSWDEWHDITKIWLHAIYQSNFEIEDVETWSEEREIVEGLLDSYFGFKTEYPYSKYWREIDEIVDIAYEQGVDSMLEAYFSGVPLHDILAE